MENEFWLQRWQQGQTAFHLDRPNPLLLKHWSALSVSKDASVFVPLCGKSHDLVWLARQGFQVSGVELSGLAIEELFREHELSFETHALSDGVLWQSENLKVFQFDLFKMDPQLLGPVDVVFDRAALIALPPSMRKGYVEKLNQLAGSKRTSLLITLEYDQTRMDGPPFSVPESEVAALFSQDFQIERLSNDDIVDRMPRFREKGLTELREPVYRLSPSA